MRPERFGNYVLVQRLGKGGMAEVFLARAQSVGGFEKLLAIKRLLPPYNIDEQIISMLGDEARLSVWLNHPNIVQVLDFGRVGQTHYIAMEYVEGCDLCDLIRPDGQSPGRPLPIATALYAMSQVADALDYAHTRKNRRGEALGIIHRDVSPHNVLISREGQVKLADFGLARASVSVHYSAAGVIRGKFSYMPKEQARGKPIDHRIDLFAAGVTLYEALTGVKPYTSATLAQQLYQLEQPIPPPSAHVPEIPEEIDDITLQAMSPDPDTRYPTAEDLARDLRDALTKYSTLNQEAERLAGLVRSMLGSRPQAISELPFMGLGDLHVPEGSLIGEELRAAQRAVKSQPVVAPPPPAREGESSLATVESPRPSEVLDEDDEGDTYQLNPGGSAHAAPPTDAMDALKTVALPASTSAPAASLPPAALQQRRGAASVSSRPTGPLPATELVGAPGEPGRELGSTGAIPLDPSSLSGHSIPTDERARLAPDPGLLDLEREGSEDELENARTVQRSPEEALAAFRRALDDRERRKRRAEGREPRDGGRLGLRATLILGAGGLLLFGIGLGVGWLLPRQAPAPSITLKKLCPESRPCPPCAGAATAADARVSADGGATSATAPGTGAPKRTPPPGGERVGNKGFLTVTTSAPARVYIDDRTQSLQAPVTRLPLAPGVHRVRVYSEQHRTFSDTQWVTIRVGESSTLSFGLD